MRISFRRLVGGVVAAVVALTGLGLAGGIAEASSGSFVSLINSSRSANGLAGYAVRSDLTAVAQAQAQRMASSGKLYHNPNLASAVKNYSWVGENVGYGPSVSALHAAFMNSSGHRANILDRQFTEVGVGVVQVGSTIWVAEVFRRPSSAGSGTTKPIVKPKPKPKPKPVVKPVVPVRRTSPAAAERRVSATRQPTVSKAPAASRTVQLPPNVTCSASAVVAERIRALATGDRTARLLDQTQHLLLGYQCGAHLPLTGAFDAGTLKALGR